MLSLLLTKSSVDEATGGKRMTGAGDIQVFKDSEDDYLNWIAHHPEGFVVNTYRNPHPGYLMLHSARCGTISTPNRHNYTTTEFIKVCSLSVGSLSDWATAQTGGRLHAC